MSKYDFIIIGGGLSGCVIARKLAESNKKVLIVEKRNHIGGNLFDFKDKKGILVQKYGPHTFHTNSDVVIDFVTKYANFNEYHLKCEVNIDGIITPSPFNFKTIDQFIDSTNAMILKEKLIEKYPQGNATVVDLLKDDDPVISNYAKFLFEKDYSLYTSKQWGISPSDVDPSVLKRVPIEFSYKDYYFYDKFEGIPQDGFMSLINNLVNHKNIKYILNADGLQHITFTENKILYDGECLNIIFTGETDELFKYKFGKLPYRSLKFIFESIEKKEYQSSAIVAYPSHDYEFTRITEYTKLPYQNFESTVIVKEYPIKYDKTLGAEPYYPILTKESIACYDKYAAEAKKYTNLFLIGRLAEFKYYNMDQCILNSLNISKKIIKTK